MGKQTQKYKNKKNVIIYVKVFQCLCFLKTCDHQMTPKLSKNWRFLTLKKIVCRNDESDVIKFIQTNCADFFSKRKKFGKRNNKFFWQKTKNKNNKCVC